MIPLILAGAGLGALALYLYSQENQSGGGGSVPFIPNSGAAPSSSGAAPSSASANYAPAYNTGVDALMQAIAMAEGSLEAHPGWNNPGDLTRSFGFSVAGTMNSDGVLAFADENSGWGALRAQLNLIYGGGSSVYSTSDSLLSMGYKWAGASQGGNWASNVAAWYQQNGYASVNINTALGDLP